MIPLRKLGHSDLEVSPVGLGVLQLGGGSGRLQSLMPAIPEQARIEIIRKALEGGINWFDTGEVYGAGRSGRLLAEALAELGEIDQNAIIATSWPSFLRFAGNIKKTNLEQSNSLNPYSIGLYQVHGSKSLSSVKAEMSTMAGLVEAGKIRAVGVSNFTAVQMRAAHEALLKRGLGLASIQVQYNLLDRQIEFNGVLETARELGIGLIASAPLASGILTGKYHQTPDMLDRLPSMRRRGVEKQIETSRPVIELLFEIASKYDTEPARVALSWVINQGQDVMAITGASRVGHVLEGIGAMTLQLSEEDLKRLDQATRNFKEI